VCGLTASTKIEKKICCYSQQMQTKLGSINVKRQIESLGQNDGFTRHDMIKELIDNSIDAGASRVVVDVSSSNVIRIVDNGRGLSDEGFRRITELFSVNDRHDGIGKFGIGSKKAMAGLADVNNPISDRRVLITSRRDGRTGRASIDYGEILKTAQGYIGGIPFSTLAESETTDHSESTFTEIEIHTSSKIYNSVEDSLKSESSSPERNLFLDLGITYGAIERVQVVVKSREEPERTVPKYDHYRDCDVVRTFHVDFYRLGDKETPYYFCKYQGEEKLLQPHGSNYKKTFVTDQNRIKASMIRIGSFNFKFGLNTRRISEGRLLHRNALNELDSAYLAQWNVDESETVQYRDHFGSACLCQRDLKVLNALKFDTSGYNSAGGSGGYQKRIILNDIKKSIIFSPDMDDHLHLVQENKSSVDWKNASRGLCRLLDLTVHWFYDQLESQGIVKPEKLRKEEIRRDDDTEEIPDDICDDKHPVIGTGESTAEQDGSVITSEEELPSKTSGPIPDRSISDPEPDSFDIIEVKRLGRSLLNLLSHTGKKAYPKLHSVLVELLQEDTPLK